MIHRAVLLLAAASAIVTAAPPAAAQQPDTAALRRQVEQQLGYPVSQEQIIERLRQSGLTRAQVRSRLQAMGYDPSLADPYFEAMEGGGRVAGQPNRRMLDAMERLGMTQLPDSVLVQLADSLQRRTEGDTMAADSAAGDRLREDRLPIFGMSLFDNARNQFVPTTFGPVSPDYRLGPGDRLTLILTGAVEDAYELPVSRQGFVVIPDVGQVAVAGLTLGQLEDRLYSLLGRVYSGVDRGPEASTRFQLTLAELRTNQVYLVGEVQQPGAYQVSAVSSALNALYHAGGPSRIGSFRRVEVRRGGRLAESVDLYDYLLTGGSREEVQLENGDRVFVPVVGTRVAIDGEIRRPARYEMMPGETLRDLVAFAGGFNPQAVVQTILIDRILPPEQRRPGVDRVVVSVPLEWLRPGGPVVELQDGDRVTVREVSEERRERVMLTGEVNRPGEYQWSPTLTLRELIEQAEGIAESAYTQRAQIYRLNERDGTRYLIPASLEMEDGVPPIRLEDRDSVVVFSRAELVAIDSVAIRGYVKEPGVYPFAEGMTLEDLILAANGFTTGANTLAAQLARMPPPSSRSDTAARVYQVPLDGTGGEGAGGSPDPGIPGWAPAAEQVPLQPGDRVFVHQAPGYAPIRSVVVTGEVVTPGTYALEGRQERLAELIARTGGLTPEAYAAGVQLVRDTTLVGADLLAALDDPQSPDNLPLMHGDSIHVPAYDPTVRVSGAVNFDSRVVYVPGKNIEYYIEQAGGYTPEADPSLASITYQNGEREMVDRFGLFRNTPEPRPGSEIYVPAVPPSLQNDTDWGAILSRTATMMGTLVTVLLALRQLN